MADPTDTEVARAIRERSDVFERHFAAGNAQGLVSDYYVDEPMMSAPDAPLLRGRAAITELFTQVMRAFSACRLEQVEIRRGGDLAYEIGRAILTPREGGDPANCRYVIAWRRTSAGWRVETDFFAWGVV